MLFRSEKGNPDESLKVVSGSYPKLLTWVMERSINMETLIILNDILGFCSIWDKKIDDDIIYPQFRRKCLKYKPFLHYDINKFRIILTEKVKEYK